MSLLLSVDKLGNLSDTQSGRTVVLRGINVDGCCKLPSDPPITSYTPVDDEFWHGDDVSFIGRPFPYAEADEHLKRIKDWGFNTIRYVFTWEALEHKGPGIYDDDFIDYTISILEKIKSYGFYVFLDPHQDAWGRYSGGSGAPLWTYMAVGIDPSQFKDTEAALVQNSWTPSPHEFPKMIWATNYTRGACQLLFTLFFAGSDYAPKARLNGMNIEEYLQTHFIDALRYFYRQIAARTDLFQTCIFAVESMNEPSMGLIGIEDITAVPKGQNLKYGTTPTAYQSMLTSSGIAQEVDYYSFGNFGPSKDGKRIVDPEGSSIWLSEEERDAVDAKYGFKRDPEWVAGICIWAQHDVWDVNANVCLKPDYFGSHQGQSVDESYFVNEFFRRHWSRFFKGMRSELGPKVFIMCQPPTLSIPPLLKDSDLIDDRVIYTPHFYDGLTLMLRKWNGFWNLDCLGYLRGRYLTPILAIKLGKGNVRNCLVNQMTAIKREGTEYLGENIPCMMSETGIPLDMNNGDSYYKTGDYKDQTAALDAMINGMEQSLIHSCLWCYSSNNKHEFGDFWNGEDFSFWSTDPLLEPDDQLTEVNDTNKPESSICSVKSYHTDHARGIRALSRPWPILVNGNLVSYSFDLNTAKFSLSVDSAGLKTSTEIFIPTVHYSNLNDMEVTVSYGEWHFDEETGRLKWWHDMAGQHTLEIVGKGDESVEKTSCCWFM